MSTASPTIPPDDLEGKRDAAELSKLRDSRIKADEETIRKSPVGNWRPEHLFTLKQSCELYRTDQQQVLDCGRPIASATAAAPRGGRKTATP
jgi:transposase